MKYLIASALANAGVDPSDWAPVGEPVVPWYPATLNNAFLAIGSFKPALVVAVEEVDLDPDTLADKLTSEYPGLPRVLHRNYVFATAVAAAKYPLGTKLMITITEDSAVLHEVGTTRTLTLWDSQPLNKEL